MSTPEKKHKLKKTTLILLAVALTVVIYTLFNNGLFARIGKNNSLSYEKDILELEVSETNYVGVNNGQVFKVTRDGIVGYDLNGQEIWADALSLDNFVVRQREPYIAVADKLGKTITIFSDKGKLGEIKSSSSIVYFSVNSKGNVAVIENMADSYTVSAYDVQGRYLGGRVTHTKEEGYPIVAEVAPDSSLILASYMSTNKASLTSNLVAISLEAPLEEITDNISYGIEQKDNFIYEIEFIKNNVWVSVGDKSMTWYDTEGKQIGKQQGLTTVFNPYITKMSSYINGYLPIIATNSKGQSTVHRSDELIYLDAKGEKSLSMEIGEPVTYFYSNDKGVVVGTRDSFKGYNKLGVELFEYVPKGDVSKVFYFPERNKGIAVSKEKVTLLKCKKEVKE